MHAAADWFVFEPWIVCSCSLNRRTYSSRPRKGTCSTSFDSSSYNEASQTLLILLVLIYSWQHWREVGNTIVGQKEFYDEQFATDWCKTRGQEWNGSVAQDSQPLQTVEQLLAMSTATIDDCVTMWNRATSESSTNTLLGLALTQPWHKSDFRICELLLRSGANPNAPDGAGRSPILQIIELAAGVWLWNDSADERRFKAAVRKRLRLLLADPRYDANPEPSESMETPLSAARGALEADRHRDRGDSPGPSFNAEIVQMLEMAHNAKTDAFVQADGAVSEDQAVLDLDLERVGNEMVRP